MLSVPFKPLMYLHRTQDSRLSCPDLDYVLDTCFGLWHVIIDPEHVSSICADHAAGEGPERGAVGALQAPHASAQDAHGRQPGCACCISGCAQGTQAELKCGLSHMLRLPLVSSGIHFAAARLHPATGNFAWPLEQYSSKTMCRHVHKSICVSACIQAQQLKHGVLCRARRSCQQNPSRPGCHRRIRCI